MTYVTEIRPHSKTLWGCMRAYSGALSNTETAQPTSTRPTSLQEDYVIQDTINQPEGGKDVYAASLAIEMTDQWAYSMDLWTAP